MKGKSWRIGTVISWVLVALILIAFADLSRGRGREAEAARASVWQDVFAPVLLGEGIAGTSIQEFFSTAERRDLLKQVLPSGDAVDQLEGPELYSLARAFTVLGRDEEAVDTLRLVQRKATDGELAELAELEEDALLGAPDSAVDRLSSLLKKMFLAGGSEMDLKPTGNAAVAQQLAYVLEDRGAKRVPCLVVRYLPCSGDPVPVRQPGDPLAPPPPPPDAGPAAGWPAPPPEVSFRNSARRF